MNENVEVRVGIADMKIVNSPDRLVTIGLGSCIGISLYDRRKKIAGLVHIMLPDSTKFKVVTNEFKYADLAVPILLSEMKSLGCEKKYIEAKIVGGASMFQFTDSKIISDVGKRNIEAVKYIMKNSGVPIVSSEVGGNRGRTMVVNSESGLVEIRSIGSEKKYI